MYNLQGKKLVSKILGGPPKLPLNDAPDYSVQYRLFTKLRNFVIMKINVQNCSL